MRQIRQVDKRTGITYVYESESYWDKDRKQSRYKPRKLVGHIDPQSGEVVPNRETRKRTDLASSRRLFSGSDHLLRQLAAQTGLDEDVLSSFPQTGSAILSVAHYLVCDGSAVMAHFARWSRTHSHPYGSELSSQRISELFEHIGQAGLEDLFRCRIQASGKEYWFFDTTSISSYSQCLEAVRWGRNKDHMPLPQINVATVLEAQSMLPVYFNNIAGNITDVTLVKTLLKDAERLGCARMKLCMDRGFYSKANIDALLGEHMKFLIGVKTSLAYVASAIEEKADELRGWRNYDEDTRVFGMRADHAWDFQATHPRTERTEAGKRRTYLYLYHSPERVVKDEEELAQLLRRLSHELESGCTDDDHRALYERYFRRVRGRWVGRDDVIAAERARFGYFALLSNDASLGATEALAIYRSKDMIEKAFGDIKDRLDFRTPRVENSETLSGKLLCIFVALTLTMELRRRMKEAGLYRRYSLPELIDELDTIERFVSEGHRDRILNITRKQTDIFTALKVEPLTVS